LIVSLQNILSRNLGSRVNVNDLKALKEDRISPLLEMNEDLALAGRVSKEAIDHLTRLIYKIEWAVQKKMALKQAYRYLLTLPGVGRILSLTIMLETGPISRFETVGDYVSYCRKVPSQWMSNGKWKGRGNRKNGNRYLAWAYSEASAFARQLYPEPRAYYNRKMQKTNAAVAHSALANKLSRAGYYVMRDQVPFQAEKLFG
jgi:transposase